MSKKDLIDAVAEAAELTKDKAGVAVDAVIAHIEKTMKNGEEVRIPGFGTFKVTKRAARKATQAQFDFAFEIAEEAQIAAFASGEPQRCMEEFLRIRAARKAARS